MDRDTIIRLAREAGVIDEFHGMFPSMERFATLVAAHEREQQQATIDFLTRAYDILKKEVTELHQLQRNQISADIRSRT